MPSTHPIQTNFTAGEFSPLLAGRVDINRYENAASLMKNFIVLPHGGAMRRPGTHYVNEVKDSTKSTRLLPFEFSDTQAYVIEAGNLYFRFYMNSGRIESPPATPVEVVTLYKSTDLVDLKYTQSADTMYLVHPSYAPRKLTRTSHTAWTLSVIDFGDGPYLDLNKTTTTLKVSANTGTGLTMTSSASLFDAKHVGSVWRLKFASVWGYVKVTAYTSATVVTVDVISALDAATPGTTTTANWREGAWSDFRGYPRTVTFQEQRLVFGGSSAKPQTLYGSNSGDFENMQDSKTDGTVLDSHAYIYTLGSMKVNVIRWLSPTRVFLVGTLGGEHKATGGTNTPITPSNINVKPETSLGSNKVQPAFLGNVVLFVQRSGRKLRELAYDYKSDSYKGPDLSELAEHLFPKTGQIVDMSFQAERFPILWLVRADGVLLGLTYDREQDVVGWHQHDTESGAGKFEAVTVIPHPDLDRDQVWFVVNRTVNGATKRYIEYFDDKNNPFAAYDASQVDCGLYYSGGPVTTLSGIGHLEGKTVKIVGDGAVYNDGVISAGAVTVAPAVSVAEVGLGYVSTLTTNRPEVKMPDGTSQGRKKKWSHIVVRLFNTLGAQVEGDQLPFRSSADKMGSPPSMFTGDRLKTNLGWSRDGTITIAQTQPLPCTVTLISGELEVE